MEKETEEQQKLARDFSTFSRILLTLASFLSLGYFLPDTFSKQEETTALIIINVLLMVSIFLHIIGKRAEEKVDE
ncbi:YrhC family protein [Alteribacillus bidgolensis]|uniref:YrhC-like protein n=1 Tax=Alteribacillus bidgolensis TaxID=930129 RepID=A0A1G8NV98_9BACI|nr:YrhC family protein [Alteribacillus bidgolensis]SDI84139.1 YrhC-like protein [Alteribacillus bidgolensis]